MKDKGSSDSSNWMGENSRTNETPGRQRSRQTQTRRSCGASERSGGGQGRGGKTAKRQITEDLKPLAKDPGLYFMKRGTTKGFSDHK